MRYNSGKELSVEEIQTLFLILKENGNCNTIDTKTCYTCPFFPSKEGHNQFGPKYREKEYIQNKINRAQELLSTM